MKLTGLGPIAFKVEKNDSVPKNGDNKVSFTSPYDGNISRFWMKRDQMIIQKRGKEWKRLF
jgi:hypothetical protein